MVISDKVLAETEKRYAERSGAREQTERKIGTESLLQVDTPQRVEKRLARLARTQAAESLDVGGMVAVATVANAVSAVALERILGKSDLVSVSYLDLALRVSRTVGRIQVRTATGHVAGFGTGFLVSPRLLLTNNHVFPSAREAANSLVECNFQEGPEGGPLTAVVFGLEPATFFLTDPELDYSVVAVSQRARDGSDLAAFGWCRLIEEEGKIILGEYVNIIQHPNGEPKQLALRENQLVDLLENFLHYRTDTAPGSSGSPVFNDQWEVVGLHHSGVPKRDSEGRLLTRDGTVWQPAMGEHRIDWVANEGARISRVVRHIKAQSLSTEQRRLRNDLFDAVPVAPIVRPAGSAPVAGQRPATTGQTERGNGQAALPAMTDRQDTAVWTVPLQVSVRIGQPVLGNGAQGAGDTVSLTVATATTAMLPDGNELREALAELEAGRRRPYYDATADRRDRDAYYQGIDGSLDPAALYRALSELLRGTHSAPLAYKPSKHVYPWVDLQPDRTLRSIYSARPLDPEALIRADVSMEQQRVARLESLRRLEGSVGPERMALELDLLEAQFPFNCEHVVPQSWFGKAEPMRGDLHHLFACEPDCNSFRGNTPFFDFLDFEEGVRTDCGKRMEGKFEPSGGKGAAARATLYFLLRYPGEINRTAREYQEDRLRVLLAWHEAEPVSAYERHRNMAIVQKQGNRNPLIDFPEWGEKIDFRLGLS